MMLLEEMLRNSKILVRLFLFISVIITQIQANGQNIISIKNMYSKFNQRSLEDSLDFSVFPRCDTVIKQRHYVRIDCHDSIGSYVRNYEYAPGLFLGYSGLYCYGQNTVDPVISLYFPYGNYIKYGRTEILGADPLVYTFLFEEGQFIILFIDRYIDMDNSNIRHNTELVTNPTEEEFRSFVEENGRQIPLYEFFSQAFPNDKDFPPQELNPYFDSDTLLRQDRITKAIKRGCCLIILYNIKQNKIKDFEDSAKSLILYEIKKVELDN